jgi:hypothetical protein
MRSARTIDACLVITAFACLLVSLFDAAPPLFAGTLRFPMTNDICPTSSFGSYRSGHLHAGMDFSTGGVTGVPVVAVDSCYVWRIRLWNGGYGKALYAQLPDGKVVVYGHLSKYRPDLEDRVEAEQDRLGKYEVELLFGPGEFPFGPGDTLAYSGDTGSGPAHLHFEIRSGQGDHNKINPVPDYLDMAEDLNPVIEKIGIVPLSPWSMLDGGFEPLVLSREAASGMLEVTGPFGVSVSARDEAQCGKVITPVLYEARLDGHTIWRFHMVTFPFSRSYLVGALYDLIGGNRFVRLFQSDPLDLSGFGEIARDQLWSTLSLQDREEPYELLVRVEDAWGNADSVAIPVRAVQPNSLADNGRNPGAGRILSIDTSVHPGYVEVLVRTDSSPVVPMRARMVGWGPKTHEFFPVGENLYRAIIQPGEKLPVDSRVRLNILTGPGDRIAAEPEAVAIGVVGSGQGFACSGERFDLDLVPPEGDLPRTLIEIKEDSAGVYERFESAAGRILLEPQGEFLYKGLEFRIRDLKGEVGPKHGVYADRDGWPVYLGRFNSAGVAEIRLRRIENLVVLQDTVPPEITSVGRFRRRSDGKATFTARVADKGSGASAGSIRGYVDGDIAIVSIDPDTARLTGRTRKALKYGNHTIRLEAEDRLGNLAVTEVVLDLSR